MSRAQSAQVPVTMESAGHLYYNRCICDASTVPEWVFDLPELLPPGVYTTFPWYKGVPVELGAHLDRLRSSVQGTEDERLSEEFVLGVLGDLAKLNGIAEAAKVRVSVLLEPWGEAKDVVVTMQQVRMVNLVERRARGVQLEAMPQRRIPGDSLYTMKRLGITIPDRTLSANWLFLNSAGEVCEATYGNLFFVRADGIVITPTIESPCLPGITRNLLIKDGGDVGIGISAEPVSFDGLEGYTEAFMTSSIGGIVPVTRINDIAFADSISRRVTTALQQKLAEASGFYCLKV